MLVADAARLRTLLNAGEVLDALAQTLVAQARGECGTPMPMHLDLPEGAEAHIKASFRRGGSLFVLKLASTFPQNATRGLSTGSGMMLLASAETGHPVALLADEGYLTDYRTAAVGALTARALGRRDEILGILGTGIQARLQMLLHTGVLPLRKVCLWGRNPDRVRKCRDELRALQNGIEIDVAASPAAVAAEARMIVTTTSSRQALLQIEDLRPGTHVSAVGSDAPGKQELDPRILTSATLLLVDSRAQCERLGELQHAPQARARAVELGHFLATPRTFESKGITVCDFTGLGSEDLAIAEYCYRKLAAAEMEKVR